MRNLSNRGFVGVAWAFGAFGLLEAPEVPEVIEEWKEAFLEGTNR